MTFPAPARDPGRSHQEPGPPSVEQAGVTVSASASRARELFHHAVAAVSPRAAMRRHLALEGERLRAGPHTLNLAEYEGIYLLGVGKAAGPMAQEMEALLGERIRGGAVALLRGTGGDYPLERVEVLEASHPVPDPGSVRAAERFLEIAGVAGERDLVLFLVSGGGSSLLARPAGRLTLEDLQHATTTLLFCGATIQEINVVRKHLESVKGGWLMRHIHPAACLTLVLSDVLGSPLDQVASGPTVPDSSSYREAMQIVDRFELQRELPSSILWHLREGLEGEREETPRPGDPCFAKALYHVVGDNVLMAEAAAQRAREMGLDTVILTTWLEGEAREAARVLAGVAREVQNQNRPVHRPGCVVASGEPTVTVTGRGKGGRCQELALAFALAVEGLQGITLLAAGSDGSDGSTDAAGAVVDGDTCARARARGLDPEAHLRDNDSYSFFRNLGEQIRTGPTGTNTLDLVVTLVE